MNEAFRILSSTTIDDPGLAEESSDCSTLDFLLDLGGWRLVFEAAFPSPSSGFWAFFPLGFRVFTGFPDAGSAVSSLTSGFLRGRPPRFMVFEEASSAGSSFSLVGFALRGLFGLVFESEAPVAAGAVPFVSRDGRESECTVPTEDNCVSVWYSIGFAVVEELRGIETVDWKGRR